MPQSTTAFNRPCYLFSTYVEEIIRLCHSSDCLINDLAQIDQAMAIRIENLYILLDDLAAIEEKVAKSKQPSSQ